MLHFIHITKPALRGSKFASKGRLLAGGWVKNLYTGFHLTVAKGLPIGHQLPPHSRYSLCLNINIQPQGQEVRGVQ